MKPFCYRPFDLREFVSFAEIARTGSFRRAAKTLPLAQPAEIPPEKFWQKSPAFESCKLNWSA